MNKKILIFGILIFVILIFVLYFGNNKRHEDNNHKLESTAQNAVGNNIYDLMMNTISRNIIGMDPADMSSDEKEFYYQYLYEEIEDMETFSYEE